MNVQYSDHLHQYMIVVLAGPLPVASLARKLLSQADVLVRLGANSLAFSTRAASDRVAEVGSDVLGQFPA